MKPLILIVMDGWGVRKEKRGNAIALAHTPNFDNFKKNYSYTELMTHGIHVGLAKNMMGGSEVGHLNIGAGRIVEQNVMRINDAIKNNSFFKNKSILKAFANIKKKKSTLHLMGLLSDAGVHSYESHLYALLKLAKEQKTEKVMIHVFADGRDTAPQALEKHIKRLNKKIKQYKVGKIATIIGRYYAMDRDNRWKRTEKAYLALTEGKGVKAQNVLAGIKEAYKKGETDEFINPIIANGFNGVKNGDSVIMFNYRADRMRQITKAFVGKSFRKFRRKKINLIYVCMTRYYDNVPALVALEKIKLKNVLAKVLSDHNINQLRISETEKNSHVTYFFNGLQEKPFPKEDRFLVPSPKVATYDMKPEMSAFKVTKKLISEINKDKYSFIVLNLVNADMVGHTGDLNAAIKAVETVDVCIGKIVKKIKEKKGITLITADHGNAETMLNSKREKLKEHTKNPVPFIIVSNKCYNLRKGKLSNIAPTILGIMGIRRPREMIEKSLIIKK